MPGVEWVGTLNLSWWELREFVAHLPKDKTSALYRALYPKDWMWADVDTLLAAETATALSDLRWLEAVGRVGDEMPKDWERRKFGPPEDEDLEAVRDADVAADRAREVAAEMRG